MKKILPKKKIKRQTTHLKKLKLASYREDFVITEQEEREGGYFGKFNYRYDYHFN